MLGHSLRFWEMGWAEKFLTFNIIYYSSYITRQSKTSDNKNV